MHLSKPLQSSVAQMILVGSKEYIEQLSNKSRHGVTPPMRDARKRLFAKPPKVDAAAMKKLEEDLLLLASVSVTTLSCFSHALLRPASLRIITSGSHRSACLLDGRSALLSFFLLEQQLSSQTKTERKLSVLTLMSLPATNLCWVACRFQNYAALVLCGFSVQW